jgi:hypothetical protein
VRWGWQPALALGGALLFALLQQDLFEWCYWLAERLVGSAARRLPRSYRRRYHEEWLAELGELRGRNISALLWALWVFAYAPSVGRGLREEAADRWRLLRNGYVTGVSAAGIGLGGWLLARGGLQVTEHGRRSFLILMALATVAQLRPYLTRAQTGSLSFGSLDLALVIGWGMAAGAPAAAFATMLGHLCGRRSADKVLFNGGQYVLCLAGAGWVFKAASELLPGSLGTLAIVGAAVVFTTLNSLLMRVLFALQHPDAMARELRKDWIVEGLMCFALIVTAPFVPLVLQSRVAFIPLLLLPEAALLLLVFRLCPAHRPPPARAARG